jgi:hypothetical protein
MKICSLSLQTWNPIKATFFLFVNDDCFELHNVPHHTSDSDSYDSDFRDDFDTVPFFFTNFIFDYLGFYFIVQLG